MRIAAETTVPRNRIMHPSRRLFPILSGNGGASKALTGVDGHGRLPMDQKRLSRGTPY